MQLIANIINKLKVRYGNLSPHELAVLTMPSEVEIREAECIADHPLAMPDVIGTRGCMSSSDEDHQLFSTIKFPALGPVIQCEREVGTKYQLWYVRTMEIWAERKAEHYRQAVLDMSAESEEQLKADQLRLEIIDILEGDRMREAQRVAASWRRFHPPFNAAYPHEAIPA